MTITDKKVVGIHYTLTNDSGEKLESTLGAEPSLYLHGAGNIIKGLEQALENKSVGDEIQATIEPQDGYGERHEKLIQVIPKESFKAMASLKEGMQIQAQTSQGEIPLTVTKIEAEQVTVDANHALAGVRLHFSVSIESIRKANEIELEHGHVHTGSCSHD